MLTNKEGGVLVGERRQYDTANDTEQEEKDKKLHRLYVRSVVSKDTREMPAKLMSVST